MITYKSIFKKMCFVVLVGVGLTTVHDQEEDIQPEQYAKCRVDEDCAYNAYCFRNNSYNLGKCKCINTYQMKRNSTFYECLQGASLGETCEDDFDCQITMESGVYCNSSKTCDCQDSYHSATDNKCYLTAGLAEICLEDANCLFSNKEKGKCNEGICVCSSSQVTDQKNTTCVFPREIDEMCSSDDECLEPNSICEDVCRCKPSYTRNEANCIKTSATLGEACEIDSQCSEYLPGSECISERCGCSAGYVVHREMSKGICAKIDNAGCSYKQQTIKALIILTYLLLFFFQ